MADGYMTALASAPGGYKSHSDGKVRLERVFYKLKRHNPGVGTAALSSAFAIPVTYRPPDMADRRRTSGDGEA